MIWLLNIEFLQNKSKIMLSTQNRWISKSSEEIKTLEKSSQFIFLEAKQLSHPVAKTVIRTGLKLIKTIMPWKKANWGFGKDPSTKDTFGFLIRDGEVAVIYCWMTIAMQSMNSSQPLGRTAWGRSAKWHLVPFNHLSPCHGRRHLLDS